MILKKRTWLAILALVLAVAMLAACSPREDVTEDQPRDVYDPNFDGLRIGDVTPDLLEWIAEMYELSNNTVGWIDVPGTNISDVVVRNPDCRDNLYYLRRDFFREFYFDGVYYIDFRADLGPTRDYLGVNTTIYGHAMSDDPESEAFNIKFGHLHRFRDPEFMRYHPYIFFSLPEENMAFEIVAVFYGNVSNPEFSYNNNHENPSDFLYVLENAVMPRSLFHFTDMEFDVNDRFLTLSTCIYDFERVELFHQTETLYHFGIIARLVDPNRPMREYVEFTINEDRIVDPDGRWPS